MGDPRRVRKKYQTPGHPWQQARLEEERPLIREYGLSNKKELWKMHSIARTISIQAKSIIAKREDPQSQKQAQLLLKRLLRYNLISPAEPVESALAITSRDILERRLQTQVVRKNFARTMRQARQLITHKHIKINDSLITSPAYLVSAEEENQIGYAERSPLSAEEHPERPDFQTKQEIKEEKERIMKPEKREEEVSEKIEEQPAEQKNEEPAEG